MEAGRELDALIAEKVMALAVIDYGEGCLYFVAEPGTCGQACRNHTHMLPHFSEDFIAAFKVVENLRRDFAFELEIIPHDQAKWLCTFTDIAHRRKFYGEERTGPHAICLAALKAVGYTGS